MGFRALDEVVEMEAGSQSGATILLQGRNKLKSCRVSFSKELSCLRSLSDFCSMFIPQKVDCKCQAVNAC